MQVESTSPEEKPRQNQPEDSQKTRGKLPFKVWFHEVHVPGRSNISPAHPLSHGTCEDSRVTSDPNKIWTNRQIDCMFVDRVKYEQLNLIFLMTMISFGTARVSSRYSSGVVGGCNGKT